MPLLFKKSPSKRSAIASDWATTLGNIGQIMDKSGLDLRDVALSIAGEEIWICGAVWWSQRVQSGWTTVTLRIENGRLHPVGTSSIPGKSPSGYTGHSSSWQVRLVSLGVLLDGAGHVVLNPAVLEVGDGFAVTVETIGTPTKPNPGLISYGYTEAELAATSPVALQRGGTR
jgi:hypothetical protein